jgi:hypothetical protein
MRYEIITGYDPAASEKWHTTYRPFVSTHDVRFGDILQRDRPVRFSQWPTLATAEMDR